MNKLTARQSVMLTVTTVFSPAVRLFSSFASGVQDQSALLAVPIAMVISLLLAKILSVLLNKKQGLDTLIKSNFGKPAGNVILFLYILWGVLLCGMHFRYYGLRVASTIYKSIPIDVFVIIMALLCVTVLLKGISTVGRINEIATVIIWAVSILLFVLLTPTVRLDKLVPLNNTVSIFHCAAFITASFGYLSLALFFGDTLLDEKSFRRYANISIIAGGALLLWLFIAIIGNLGTSILSKLPYPFFAVVRQITVGEFLQHIEAFVVALWIVSDFINICFIAGAVIRLIGNMTKTSEKNLIIPFLALCVSIVPFFGKTSNELEWLTERFFVPANIVFLFIIPFLTYIIIKIKEKAALKKAPESRALI